MKLLLSLLLLIVSGAAGVFAQSASTPAKQLDPFISEHQKRQAQNPEGVLFTVRLKENRKQFHVGEIIALELSFAASKPATFTLDAATYDRSGRLFSDGFALDRRDGAVDPIADYFNSRLDGFDMGGLRSIPDLTEKPYLMTVEMNEWQRIDRPGHYRLYVVSSRVGKKGGHGIFLENSDSHVVSNVIEFDVLPADKKWTEQKLNEAISLLSKTDGDHYPACRTLRFLGTPSAAIEMRKRFRGDDSKCEWQYKFGLIGSPHRDFVIRDMENAISLREQAVTSHFIDTLALLEFTKRTAGAPSNPAEDDEQISQWLEQRRGIYNDFRLRYLQQLVLAITQKQGKARATSLETLLDFRREVKSSDFAQWSSLLASLPEVFTRLPLGEQLRLLDNEWKPIANAAMLPVLREVFNYSYPPQKDDSSDFNVFRQEELRSTALRRLYELSPDEGRLLILKEIARPKPRVDRVVLRSLPDETLPELNDELIINLEEASRSGWYTDEISELLERYATDEILSRAQAVYDALDKRKWDCPTQAPLLAYFLRVAPSVGAEYLKKALTVRNTFFPRCYTELLTKVAELHMSPELEEIATAALDDEDPSVVRQAASVLAEYGSADAEKALWRRLVELNQKVRSQTEGANDKQEKIEKALREALTHGQAWLSDPAQLKRVRDLCFTDKSRDEMEQMITGWDSSIYINTTYFDDISRINLASHEYTSLDAVKKKLLQFPKGTVFKFRSAPTRADDSKGQELFQQIKSYLEEHGMTLKREPVQ